MSITLFGLTANPADNGTLDDVTKPMVITPPASMLTGDIAWILAVGKSAADSITLSHLGGQLWTSENLYQGGAISQRLFWCRFNGTWTADPSVTDTQTGLAFSLLMGVFRPTVGTNTWAVDLLVKQGNFVTPISPGDVTVSPRTPTVANSTVTLVFFMGNDNCTWTLQTTPTWTPLGTAQYRNLHTADPSRQLSLSCAYRILSAPGALGTVTNQQDTSHLINGNYTTITFKEQSAGVTIASAGDALFHQGETGIVIAGTAFGASHTGSADIIVSAVNAIGDASAVVQTQTAWADTSVTMTASGLTTFPYATDLFLFVKSSTGASNSSGFVIRREAGVSLAGVLKNLAGTPQINLTNLQYRATLSTINGALVTPSGSNGTTDGSGNFLVPLFYSPNVLSDNAWVSAAFDGATPALSPAFIGKITPTYT